VHQLFINSNWLKIKLLIAFVLNFAALSLLLLVQLPVVLSTSQQTNDEFLPAGYTLQ
jgi:hypothetical protein